MLQGGVSLEVGMSPLRPTPLAFFFVVQSFVRVLCFDDLIVRPFALLHGNLVVIHLCLSNLPDLAFVFRYLRPALEDDALLLSLEELLLQGENDNENDDDDNDESPTAAAAAAAAATAAGTGVEEEKRGVLDQAAASTSTTTSAGETAPETAEARVAELEEENARLREALQAADARMGRANRVLRSLAGGRAEGENGSGGEEEDDGEGSVAGVSELSGQVL